MSLLKVKKTRHRFLGADGLFHTVRQCPITKLIDLRDWLELIRDAIAAENEAGKNRSIQWLYLNDERFQQLCHSALQACGIEPEWVGMDQLRMLLFFHETDDGVQPGIISQLNEMDKPSGDGSDDGELMTLEQYESSVCAGLVNLGLAVNMAEARAYMETVPLGEMEAVMSARADSLKSPEQKKKEKEEARVNAEMESMKAEISQRGIQSVLGDFMSPGKAGKRKITD